MFFFHAAKKRKKKKHQKNRGNQREVGGEISWFQNGVLLMRFKCTDRRVICVCVLFFFVWCCVGLKRGETYDILLQELSEK